MADEKKRFFRIPKTPKQMAAWGGFVKWMLWYAEAEKRLRENHANAMIIGRLYDALEDLKPATDEVDAIKDAEEHVAEHEAKLAEAKRTLEALRNMKEPPAPIPAYEGDIGEMREADWQKLIGWLTSEKDAPECGYGQAQHIQAGDKVIKIEFPMRPVLELIEHLRGAKTSREEVEGKVEPEAPPAEEKAAE